MRTISGGYRTLLKATRFHIYARAQVANGSGTYKELTTLGGVDWFTSFEWSEALDQPVMQGTLKLARESGAQTIAPMMQASALNVNDVGAYSPLLDIGRGIRVDVACMAPGSAPAGGDWVRVFEGIIDDVQWSGDNEITVPCRDKGSLLLDKQIEVLRNYGNSSGIAVETVMQTILDDNLGAGVVTLVTPVTPAWFVKTYTQDAVKVYEAIKALAQQIGWDVRYMWNAAGVFELRFFQPDRAKTVEDTTFDKDEYTDIPMMKVSLDTIRNAVRVKYMNSATGSADSETRINAASITAYGRRFMEIEEPPESAIDTPTEAGAMAQAAVDDLALPFADHEIETFLFWPAQLGDLYKFVANGVHYSTDQKIAVVSIRHLIENGHGTTKIQTRGKPAGAYYDWLRKGQVPASGETPVAGVATAIIVKSNNASPDIFQDVTYMGLPSVAAGPLSAMTYRRKLSGDTDGAWSAWAALPGVGVLESIARLDTITKVIDLEVRDILGNVGHRQSEVSPAFTGRERGTDKPRRAKAYLEDSGYATRASDTSGNVVHSAVTESGGKAVNRFLAKTLAGDADTADGVPNGTTYQIPTATGLNGSRQVDLAQAGVVGKNLGNVARSAGDGTLGSTIIQRLTNLGHLDTTITDGGGRGVNRFLAKILTGDADTSDGVPNGTTYQIPIATGLNGSRQVDLTLAGVVGKTLDNIAETGGRKHFIADIKNAIVNRPQLSRQEFWNPDFEDGLKFWELPASGTLISVTDSTKAFQGNKYAQLTTVNAVASQFHQADDVGNTRFFEVSAGESIQTGMRFWRESGSQAIGISMVFLDKDLAVVRTVTGSNITSASYTLSSAEAVVGATEKYLRVKAITDAAAGPSVFRIDGGFLRILPPAADIVAGNFRTNMADNAGRVVQRFLAKTLTGDADTADGVPNGTTYQIPVAAALNGSRQVDFSTSGVVNRNASNLARSGADATLTSTIIANLTNSGNLNGGVIKDSDTGRLLLRFLAKALTGDPDTVDLAGPMVVNNLVAARITAASLAAISAVLGVVNSGLIQNSASPTRAIRLDSGSTLPGGLTSFIDLAATGTGFILKFGNGTINVLTLDATGTLVISGVIVPTALQMAVGSSATMDGTLLMRGTTAFGEVGSSLTGGKRIVFLGGRLQAKSADVSCFDLGDITVALAGSNAKTDTTWSVTTSGSVVNTTRLTWSASTGTSAGPANPIQVAADLFDASHKYKIDFTLQITGAWAVGNTCDIVSVIRARLYTSKNAGGAWKDQGVIASLEHSGVRNASTSFNFTGVEVTVPDADLDGAVNSNSIFKIVPEVFCGSAVDINGDPVTLTATGVCTTTVGTEKVAWSKSGAGTTFDRRYAAFRAVAGQPLGYFEPVPTASLPTDVNAVDGEFGYSSDDHALHLWDGRRRAKLRPEVLKYLAADNSAITSTTGANVPNLDLAVTSGEIWEVEWVGRCTLSVTTAGITFNIAGITFTASSFYDVESTNGVPNTGAAQARMATNPAGTATGFVNFGNPGSTTLPVPFKITAWVKAGSTATLSMQIGSSSGTVTVLEGSRMRARRVA